MRTIRWFLTLTILFLASLTLSSTKALVIGIGNYSDSTIEQLPGAIEDARAFAEALKRNGVEPKIKENLTLSQLNVELSKWAREGEEEDILILYFAGHGYTLKDEPYLIPSDANSGYIREDPDKVAYNLSKGLKELSEDIVAKEVLIIIDACYSGSLIKGARPLQDPRISEFSIDSLIKEKSYVFLLSSKSNETSGQMDEGRGHFTYYLLKGIEGEANRDKDDKITVKEVYDYLREEVRKATNNSQTPVMVGDREIVIAWDLRSQYAELAGLIITLNREEKLTAEQLQLYTKILFQKESLDNELEKKVRGYLLNYLKDKNLTSLIAQTTVAMLQSGTTPQTSQQTQSQVTTPQRQTKGNCLLKIIAGNELAKSGTVEIDGIMEGTLEQGVLVVDHLGVGTHKIVLEGEKINRLEKEITFNYDYGALEVELNAEIATAVIKIVTIPPNAKIWIDGRELSSRSPWQEPVEVGKVYDLEVLLEGYGRETRKVNVPKKGELIEQSITIPPYPSPEKPVLTYPANNSKDIPVGNITLKWESKESNLTYRVEFDGKTYTTTNKIYTVSANERGKTYSWRVTAINEWEKETSSDTYSFTTKGNSAPEITLLSPENGSTGVQPESITLKWTGKDSDGDEISYRVYFGETSSPTYITTTKQSEYKVSNKEPGKKYYWRVEASDNYGGTTTSKVYSFTTKENKAPIAPSNPSPSNNATNQPLTVTLSWDCSDPDGDAITYDVYFGTSSNPPKLSTNQSGKTLSKGNLSAGTTYYWKVVAKDSKGGTIEGPVWSFTTQSNRAPNQPSVPDPYNYSTNNETDLTLSWECSDPDGDAITYDVYFGTNSNPTTRVSAGQTGKTLNRSNLSIGTTYYWKVVAKDSKGATTEGPVWRFTTQGNRAPNTPSNPSPSNNATNQPITVTLSWDCSDPDGDTVTYDVYFGTSSNPTAKASTSQSGKTLSKGNLSAGTTYYWKVVAKDVKGAITEGPVWTFTTQSVPTASSYTPSSIVPQMVLVEKGSFMMGDTWGGGSDAEKPTHKVTFTYNFYIGKYEVTFSEYDAFCKATGRSKPSDSGWGRGSRPVINVSWWDAIAYCNWLSEKEKLPKAYDKDGNFLDKDGRVTTDPSKVVGYRLPTEAEWEYAARGGKKSRGYKYSGSDNVGDVTWYYSNSGGKTQEVGKKAPNELGIYDMSGNVWEWCSDWYGNYSSSAQTNPYYSTAGSYRVNRGGSWSNSATFTRVANRNSDSPTNAYNSLGFRICRTVP